MLFPDKTQLPSGFAGPTQLPQTTEQAGEWQAANRSWWERHPMRYDFNTNEVPYPEFSKEFFLEIDRRFFSVTWEFMPWRSIPFDPLIDFASLRDKDVLEIGVGNGSHAQLLAQHARTFTGIDITDYAIKSTSARMRAFDLDANLVRMDAERMEFADETFDFIWSWGVIHHSANTNKVLQEMHRVLKPGGTAITMVYHRSFWYYYVLGGLFNGILKGQLLRTRSLHQVTQQMIDGAVARFYTIPEWERLLAEFFELDDTRVYGAKAEVIPLPGGKFKRTIMKMIPNAATRMLTNRFKMGYFLVTKFRKAE